MKRLQMLAYERLGLIAENPKMPAKWAARFVVAQADDGEMYLACRGRRFHQHAHTEPWWDRPLDLRRVTHWPYALFSLATGWVMWVEPS